MSEFPGDATRNWRPPVGIKQTKEHFPLRLLSTSLHYRLACEINNFIKLKCNKLETHLNPRQLISQIFY